MMGGGITLKQLRGQAVITSWKTDTIPHAIFLGTILLWDSFYESQYLFMCLCISVFVCLSHTCNFLLLRNEDGSGEISNLKNDYLSTPLN